MPKYRESVANFLLKERRINIISEIPDRIKCYICKNVIVDAMQTPCGCRYCSDCITNYLNGQSKYCPGNTEECHEEKLELNYNVVYDFGTDRDIRRLRFRCENVGCVYEGELSLMDDHLENCPFGEELCELCGNNMQRMHVARHIQEECEERLIECQYCGAAITANDMLADHANVNSENVCSKFVSVCPLKCDVTTPVVIRQHRSACSNRPRNCPYDVVGCPAKGYTKGALNLHINNHIFDHSKILFERLAKFKEENNRLQLRLKLAEDNFQSFVWKLENFSKIHDKNAQKVIMSPTFSLGRHGYNAAVEISTSDDFIRIFFLIVKGEYDDILMWPFNKKITIMIMDQSGNEQHYSKMLRTADDPDCFLKPIGETTKGYGFVKFISLDVLLASSHLLRSDRLFIKCIMHA